MSSKDKLIGIVLILLGMIFVALGVMSEMRPATINNNQVYTEQNAENNTEELPDDIDEPEVNIYAEATNTNAANQVVENDQQQDVTASDEE